MSRKTFKSWNILKPNEEYPIEAPKILERFTDGDYIGVGSERVLMATARAKADGIVSIDSAPGTHAFHVINRVLLKISLDRGQYLQLRLAGSFNDWQNASHEIQLSPQDRATLGNSIYWRWWQINIVHNRGFKEFHQPPKNQKSKYYRMNYLFDDAAFDHLKTLTETNRYFIYNVNLDNSNEVADLLKNLKQKGISIGALDISNAWWSPYISDVKRVFQQFSGIAKKNSLLILTNQNDAPTMADHWKYLGLAILGGLQLDSKEIDNIFAKMNESAKFLESPTNRCAQLFN